MICLSADGSTRVASKGQSHCGVGCLLTNALTLCSVCLPHLVWSAAGAEDDQLARVLVVMQSFYQVAWIPGIPEGNKWGCRRSSGKWDIIFWTKANVQSTTTIDSKWVLGSENMSKVLGCLVFWGARFARRVIRRFVVRIYQGWGWESINTIPVMVWLIREIVISFLDMSELSGVGQFLPEIVWFPDGYVKSPWVD